MTEFVVGGYGAAMGGTARGIGRGRSHADGRFEFLGLVAEADSPSWLTVAAEHVFAALEADSAVAAWERGDDGSLLARGVRPSGDAAGPCHLAVVPRPGGDALVAARYGDGVVAVHAIDPGDPSILGPAEQELPATGSGPRAAQRTPHAHCVLVLDDGRVATADLGADRVYLHRWDGARLRRVAEVRLPPGTGPRDLVALPDGELAVLGEWGLTVSVLHPAGDTFEVRGFVDLPGVSGQSQAAGLALSSDGRFVVAGVRGANRLAVISFDSGAVRLVGDVDCGGDWPRHLVVDGAFVHVANQLSNSVASFALDADGRLTPVGEPVHVPSPTCLAALS
ncbi:beta-propeller fold lactonase family protein [uncultured Schumannella sp.]|uniref:lactonase family protein n=1 Tax=uncultured Schumannella sp. TaxID=1195956 RepID=UPI0025F0D62B|nr:beta-propeller fold lactonase family protein [uncultured Schumannella sp.]